jgi:ligand-binding sensor domain-containing protein
MLFCFNILFYCYFFKNKLIVQRHFFLLTFFFFFSISNSVSQRVFDYLTIKEGLPHNTVNAIAQDNSGFMWLATQSGLLRYDAYSFQTFPKVKTRKGQELNIRSAHALLYDSQERLWIGTEADGLLLHNVKTGEWSQVIDFQTVNSRINAIFEGKNGSFWIATMGNGCFYLDQKLQIKQHLRNENGYFQNNNIFAFGQNQKDKIWIAGAGTGLYVYDMAAASMQQIHNQITLNEDLNAFRKCLFFDEKQQLWIGTEGDGLYILNTQNNIFQHYKKGTALAIPSNTISDIRAMPDGKIWLSSDGDGLLECDPNNMVFSSEKSTPTFYNTLNTNNLLKIFLDKNANVWLATYNGGINIFKRNKTHFSNLKEWSKQNIELANRSVLGLFASKNSAQLYCATDGGGLNIWQNNRQSWQTLQAKNNNLFFPSGNVPKAILEDSRSNLWVGYFNRGLDCYNSKTGKNKHFSKNVNDYNALSGENIWALCEDKNNDIWAATLDGGLNKISLSANKITRYLHDPYLPNSIAENSIFCVLSDENNKIWLGTQNSGLDFFDPVSEIFTHFKHSENPKSISANDIRCVYKDHENRLWIGTESGGLNLWLGDGNFQHFNTADGLLNNAIMNIIEDDNGMLWLSSFQGISRFNPYNFYVTNYDFHTPNLSNQFNQLSATKLPDGTLCFGGINGIHFIDPKQILNESKARKVEISVFKLFNHLIVPNDETNILSKSWIETKEIVLDYTQNSFEIEFSALAFCNQNELKYAYQLEGADKEWRYCDGNKHSAAYNNLSHGNYVFHVKTTNNNGEWSEEIREIKIIIKPPFWKTFWFRLLVFLILATAAAWAFRLYTQHREAQLKAEIVTQEREILYLQNEKLVSDVRIKNTELMSKALQMAHKSEIMQKIKDGLSEFRKDQNETSLKKLRTLENIVNFELQDEDNWQQLNIYFNQINQNFTERLLKDFPNLTQNDIRVCILIKLNLSVKEMAILLNVSVPGIEKSKYRLKKRINLNIEDDLNDFLRKF